MDELLDQLKREIPAIFAATELDNLTGKAIRWRTIQNIRAKKDFSEAESIPDKCFFEGGEKKDPDRQRSFSGVVVNSCGDIL